MQTWCGNFDMITDSKVKFKYTLNIRFEAWVLQWNIFTDCSGVVLLLWIICVICVFCFSCFRVCSFLLCGHLPRRWLASRLLFVMFDCVFVAFPCDILGQVWYLIVTIPDRCCHLSLNMNSVYLFDERC